MKISINTDRVMRAYNQNVTEVKHSSNSNSKSDKVELSTQSKEISKYIEKAKNSEIKNERVDEVKKLLEKGNYNVDSETLAKSIMEYLKEGKKYDY
jgi:negative regulator of flagellin synthesis FlgM